MIRSKLENLKKNFMVPFYGWGSTVSRLLSHYKETVYFLPFSSLESHSIDRLRKNESLSWPWSHPVVLNPGSLDCSALITRPLLHKKCRTVSFSTTPLSGCFCCMAIFGTQNKSVQIKIVLNFSVLLYCGVSQVFNTFQSRNQHMKCLNAQTLFSEREKNSKP